MNKMKKTSAALMAAAVLAVAAPMTVIMPEPLGVVASAAETKLVTGSLDAAIAEKLTSNNFVYLGKGYYVLLDTVSDSYGWTNQVVNKIVRIGDKEIEQWRNTGKLEPTTVQSDFDVSGMEYVAGNLNNGDYITFVQQVEYNNFYVLKLDETAGKLTKAYDFITGDGEWVYGLSNGQTISYASYSIGDGRTSTGEKFEIKWPENSSRNTESVICDSTTKYLGYWNNDGIIYGIRKDGNIEKIFDLLGYFSRSGDNWVSIKDYSTDSTSIIIDGQLYNLGEQNGSVYSVNGSVVTVQGQEGFRLIDDYKLIDLTGKELSQTYALIATYDNGNTYIVKTADGKWGFIDSTGKELAMFDDAGSFSNECLYAPVVKDGKGWLIDKNMNQVSEKIDAVGCNTFGSGQLIRFITAKDSEGNATADVWVTATASGSSTETPSGPSNPTISIKQQSFRDDKTDISVDGKFPEGTTLKTETKQTSDTKVSWDITPVDANGNKVQPEGDATVKLPIPNNFKGKTVYVYRIENGKYTALESIVDGDYIVFKTNHFTEYVLTTEKVENKTETNPATGYSATAAVGFIALAGAFAIVSKKKR